MDPVIFGGECLIIYFRPQQDTQSTVFARDNRVFTTPHASPFPHHFIPPKHWVDTRENPSNYLTTGYCHDNYPALAFVQERFPWSDDIFRRLIFNESHISYDCTCRGYALDSVKAQSWWVLEWSLLKTIEHLSKRQWYSLDISTPPLPSQLGYRRTHKTRQIALHRARSSRDAFRTLAATVSMLMARINTRIILVDDRPAETVGLPYWGVEIFIQGTGIPWIECLNRSTISKFDQNTNPRIGAVFDVRTSPHLDLVKAMENAQVPIWFDWGNNPQDFEYGDFRDNVFLHWPSNSQAQLAYRQDQERLLDIQMLLAAVDDGWWRNEHMDYVQAARPEIPHTGGQLEGETCKEFVHRRAMISWSSRELDGETLENYLKRAPVDHDRRNAGWDVFLQKQLSAKAELSPGGAAVWYWEDNRDGFRMRTLVDRGKLLDMWDAYGPRMKIFDAQTDEWDVCSEFDDGEEKFTRDFGLTMPDIAIALSNEEHNFEPDQPAPGYELTTAKERENLNYVTMWGRWQDVHVSWEAKKSYDTLEQGLYYRFGLKIGVDQPSAIPHFKKPAPWEVIRKIVSDRSTPMKSNDNQNFISTFVLQAVHEMVIPDEVCDFGWVHLQPQKFEVTRMTLLHPSTQVQMPYYRLTSTPTEETDEAVDWFLILEDPAVVVECMRRRLGPSLVDIAKNLSERGVAFKTLRSCLLATLEEKIPQAVTHGWRPENYRPTGMEEYMAYQSIRIDFLKQRRMRAALMCGGIVWRLAIETLTADAVIAGPSHDSYHEVVQEHSTHENYYDDHLSVIEQDFICGVYKVATGKYLYLLLKIHR